MKITLEARDKIIVRQVYNNIAPHSRTGEIMSFFTSPENAKQGNGFSVGTLIPTDSGLVSIGAFEEVLREHCGFESFLEDQHQEEYTATFENGTGGYVMCKKDADKGAAIMEASIEVKDDGNTWIVCGKEIGFSKLLSEAIEKQDDPKRFYMY